MNIAGNQSTPGPFVIAMVPGSPAHDNGKIKPGDQILEVSKIQRLIGTSGVGYSLGGIRLLYALEVNFECNTLIRIYVALRC